jgi:thiosulfate dehydrogenase [quinone] large subunit
MFVQFLRNNVYIANLLTALRLYLGWIWIQAGFKKITGGFDATGFLNGAIKKSVGERPAVQAWWADFLNDFAIPYVGFFNVLVPWGEFLVGLGLILGTFTTFAVLMGAVMNFSYMFSGTISTNPQMVIFEMILLVAGFNAARIGLDHWIIPFVRKQILYKEAEQKQKLRTK